MHFVHRPPSRPLGTTTTTTTTNNNSNTNSNSSNSNNSVDSNNNEELLPPQHHRGRGGRERHRDLDQGLLPVRLLTLWISEGLTQAQS